MKEFMQKSPYQSPRGREKMLPSSNFDVINELSYSKCTMFSHKDVKEIIKHRAFKFFSSFIEKAKHYALR